jgi:Glycosyl transferases group 1
MNASRTILVVFPNPIWPVAGGGSARAWALMDGLRGAGYTVVLIAPDAGVANEEIRAQVDGFECFVPRGRKLATRVKEKMAGASLPEKLRMPELEKCVARVSGHISPVACITHFVRTARVLDGLPDDCLKLIDTIDIQHLRGDDAARNGGVYTGPQWSREEEAGELNRAGVLMAIQELEAATLREMCPERNVVTVGHSVAVEPPADAVQPPEVLCVGNAYAPNVEGLSTFLDESWESIRAAIPDATLHVCGRVCDAVAPVPKDVVLHGVVDDLKPYYRRAAVVINPVPYGTGLKIKTVEALGFGKAVVSTSAGVLGISGHDTNPVQVVDSSADMARSVIDIVGNREIRRDWESKAHQFAQNNLTMERVMEPLLKVLNDRP